MRQRAGVALRLWLAVFAFSAAIGGAGFALIVVPWSRKGWEEFGIELPWFLVSMIDHGVLWAAAAVVCGLAAVICLFTIEKRGIQLGLYIILAAVPALIAILGIISWWNVYIGTIDQLTRDPMAMALL